MGEVITLPVGAASNSLHDAYMDAIADGYNKLLDLGQVDRDAVQVMVGFLSAATIAFRMLGNEDLASRFECAANDLKGDWRTFQRVILALCAERCSCLMPDTTVS